MKVRKAAVAGHFYPDDPEKLKAEIRSYLLFRENIIPPPKALVAPHAGTIYSGPIAGTAYSTLTHVRQKIQRVVLLGPAHYVALQGLAASTADFFQTPLGDIPLDQATLKQIVKPPEVQFYDEAHKQEHSLELHLPFLQEVLEDFVLLPLVVGYTEPREVANVLSQLWGSEETLIVVSTDLSHYHDYAMAQALDQKTSDSIEKLRPEEIQEGQACGYYPLRGLLLAAKQHHLKAQVLDLRNSGDTAGFKDQVVGYGAYAFS